MCSFYLCTFQGGQLGKYNFKTCKSHRKCPVKRQNIKNMLMISINLYSLNEIVQK